ncbi:MAG: prepilin-type N-terminal cleavage/methylation domain-containing protein, partial [Stenotrophomonas maltophilia]
MGQQGFTLIEQIVTVAIMSMVLVAGIAALSTGALGLTVTVSRNQAMNLAQQQLECIKALPYDPPEDYSTLCTVTEDGYQVA